MRNFICGESLQLPNPLLSMSKGFAGTLVLGRAPPAEPLVKTELILTMPFLSQFSKKCHGVLKDWAEAPGEHPMGTGCLCWMV